MLDQFYNSRQLVKLGVAPPAISFDRVASAQDEVIAAVRVAMESVEMRDKAQDISKRLDETDGAMLCAEKILQTYPPQEKH